MLELLMARAMNSSLSPARAHVEPGLGLPIIDFRRPGLSWVSPCLCSALVHMNETDQARIASEIEIGIIHHMQPCFRVGIQGSRLNKTTAKIKSEKERRRNTFI